MNCSRPGSFVHGIFQARLLEWVAISSSRESSWPRDPTRISRISYIDRRILYCPTWATPETDVISLNQLYLTLRKDLLGRVGIAEADKQSQDFWALVFSYHWNHRALVLTQINDLGDSHRRPTEECRVKSKARPLYKAILRSGCTVPLSHSPDKILCPEQRLSPKQQYSCMFYFSFPWFSLQRSPSNLQTVGCVCNSDP